MTDQTLNLSRPRKQKRWEKRDVRQTAFNQNAPTITNSAVVFVTTLLVTLLAQLPDTAPGVRDLLDQLTLFAPFAAAALVAAVNRWWTQQFTVPAWKYREVELDAERGGTTDHGVV